jgi:uncharacterized protein (DUF58 family)
MTTMPRRRRRPSARRRYHLHAPGMVYAGVTVFLVVGSINSQNNLLFWALGIAVGGILVSGVLSGAALMGVVVRRERIEQAHVGSPLAITYTIENRNRITPVFGLTINELSAHDRARRVTWPRVFSRPSAFVMHVGPGETVHAEAIVWPTRRGEVTFDRLRAWSTFPFGIAKKSVTFSQPQQAIVRPMIPPLRRDLLTPVVGRGQAGYSSSELSGAGEEFYGLREYKPGDSPRLIAWKASARTDQLVIRQHAAPSPTRLWVHLVFAGSGVADRDAADERAICMVAGILDTAYSIGMDVGLVAENGVGSTIIEPRRGRRHVTRLMDALALCKSGGEGGGTERHTSGAGIGGRSARIDVLSGERGLPSLGRPSARLRIGAESVAEALAPHASDAVRAWLLKPAPEPWRRRWSDTWRELVGNAESAGSLIASGGREEGVRVP